MSKWLLSEGYSHMASLLWYSSVYKELESGNVVGRIVLEIEN